MGIRRRAFAASDWKLPVAGIAVAACVGALVWQAVPSRSERTDKPKPRIVRADGSTEMPEQRRGPTGPPVFETAEEDAGRSYSFERVRSAEDVAEQMGRLESAVAGMQDAALSSSVRSFLEPINAGSHEDLDSAILALGGEIDPDEDGRGGTEGLFGLFAGLLEHAALDTDAIEIRDPSQEIPPGDGIRIGRSRNVDEDPETGEVTETVSNILTGAPSRLFPDAAGEGATGKLVEVRLPFRSKGNTSDEPDVVLLLQMRNVGGTWQPAGFIGDVRNEELMGEIIASMQTRRAAPRGG